MKINIGEYKNYIGPYQIAENILFWLDRHESDTVHNFGRFLSGNHDSILNNFCEWIQSKRSRKIDVRIDSYDTWSMDSTLSYIIAPMLKQLKETKHGIPMSMSAFEYDSNSTQGSFEFYSDTDQCVFDTAEKQWNEILDKMIWAFEQNNIGWEDKYTKQSAELDMKEYPEDEGKECVPIRWKTEGEYDLEGMKLHLEKIEEGYKLFGEYFSNLWD
jgi:hypothetical protein